MFGRFPIINKSTELKNIRRDFDSFYNPMRKLLKLMEGGGGESVLKSFCAIFGPRFVSEFFSHRFKNVSVLRV